MSIEGTTKFEGVIPGWQQQFTGTPEDPIVRYKNVIVKAEEVESFLEYVWHGVADEIKDQLADLAIDLRVQDFARLLNTQVQEQEMLENIQKLEVFLASPAMQLQTLKKELGAKRHLTQEQVKRIFRLRKGSRLEGSAN